MLFSIQVYGRTLDSANLVALHIVLLIVMWTPALGRKEKIMKLKRNALLLICFFACSFMLAADPANGQKKIAQNFFGAANQPYAELVYEG